MRFGSLWGAGFGSPDNHVLFFEPSIGTNGNLSIRAQAAAGFGNAFFGVYANTKRVGVLYLPEGEIVRGNFHAPVVSASLAILRHGTLSDYLMDRPARSYEAATSKRATLTWSWSPEILGTPDITWLTSWSLAGVLPSMLTLGQPITRGQLTATVTIDGAAVTVSVSNGGDPLASGTGTASSTITLTGTLSGAVTVGPSPVVASAPLLFRFPSKMEVLRGLTDPPTIVVATILFDNLDMNRWTELTDLAAGTYHYRLRTVSDTGEQGASGASVTAVIPGPPGAPTGLHYHSGNAAATVIHWTASPTVGATYRLYVQPIAADFMDMNIYTVVAAGSTSATLTAIVGYPGSVRILLRAVNGGVEEANLSFLNLEYDASGNYVPPRPNNPTFGNLVVLSGLTISLQGAYTPYGEKGTPTKLQLFSRSLTGSYDFTATPDAEGTLDAGTNVRLASISKTYLTAGWLYLTLKAATAAGVQSESYATEHLVYISDATVAAPTFTAEVSRG